MTEFDRPAPNPTIALSPGTDYRDYVNSILEYIAACHRQADLDPDAKRHLAKIAGYLLDMIDRLKISPIELNAERVSPRRGPSDHVN